ncbi:MAG: GtrA family protein [Methylococcales bacterium]|nr:GtrA family protein [Methylococcales bacterium]
MNKSLLQQIWRFALVGVAGYIVNACMVEALAPAMGPIWAQVLAFPVAVTVTWWLNRRYTFGASHRALHHEWLRFVLANALGWVANNGAYVWMIFNMPLAYKHPALAVAVGSLAGMVFNFAMTRQFVFKPSIREKNNMQNIKKIYYYTALVSSGLISIYLFFYKQFNSNFSVLFGDPYDGVIEAVLVGHWYKVVSLLHHWNQPFFFYPHVNTLGYNDSYFIYGLLSLPFRFIGMNILITQEFVHVIVKATGFFSMVWLLNTITAKKSYINFFGAALFVLMINSSNQAYHGQLLSVAFSPLLFGIALKAITSIDGRDKKFIVWGALFSIAYVAWLLTSFYMAWFFGLYCILVFLVALVVDYTSIKFGIRALINNKKSQTSFLGLFFVVCTTPFLLIYIPKLQQTGGRSYLEDALFGSLRPWELINFGPNSLIWGKFFDILSAEFPGYFRGGEYAVGFTPDIFLSIAVLFVLYFFNKNLKLTTLQFSMISAGVIGLILPISIHDYSLWWFIYHWIPGASGVRLIARLWVFLSFPIAIAITIFVHKLNSSHHYRFFSFFFVAILLLGQINTSPPINLDVRSVLRLLDDIPASPKACKAFFVLEPAGYSSGDKYFDDSYRLNIEAMLISDHVNLPTINGTASFYPPDWNFSEVPKDNYLARVSSYSQIHHIENICEYNIKNYSWKINPFSEELK